MAADDLDRFTRPTARFRSARYHVLGGSSCTLRCDSIVFSRYRFLDRREDLP